MRPCSVRSCTTKGPEPSHCVKSTALCAQQARLHLPLHVGVAVMQLLDSVLCTSNSRDLAAATDVFRVPRKARPRPAVGYFSVSTGGL